MIRRPPRSTLDRSSAASDVYKRQLSHTYPTKSHKLSHVALCAVQNAHLCIGCLRHSQSGARNLPYNRGRLNSCTPLVFLSRLAGITITHRVAIQQYQRPAHQFKCRIYREANLQQFDQIVSCLLYTSPSPRDRTRSRMPPSA